MLTLLLVVVVVVVVVVMMMMLLPSRDSHPICHRSLHHGVARHQQSAAHFSPATRCRPSAANHPSVPLHCRPRYVSLAVLQLLPLQAACGA